MSDPNFSAPRYRVQLGRPRRSIEPPITRRTTMVIPLDLWQEIRDECKEPDVAHALMGLRAEANNGDFIRAAITVFLMLLRGRTRARALALANLSEDRYNSVIAHLNFEFGATWDRDAKRAVPMTEEEMAENQRDETDLGRLYRQAEDVEPLPEGTAPLDEVAPWDRF